ncbi:MAG: VanZ family protein [Clostridia bacterium]|nr:VanZ family protein [Clostridia bacterium]
MSKKHVALIALRVLLGILILLNMWLIFSFSSQSATESGKTSEKVGETITDTILPPETEHTPAEQEEFKVNLLSHLRKIAHAVEFGTLASFIFLLLLTWNGYPLIKYFISIGAAALYAVTDEIHQHFSDGRNMSIADVGIDSIGIVVCTSLILGTLYLLRYLKKRRDAA